MNERINMRFDAWDLEVGRGSVVFYTFNDSGVCCATSLTNCLDAVFALAAVKLVHQSRHKFHASALLRRKEKRVSQSSRGSKGGEIFLDLHRVGDQEHMLRH